MVVVELEAVIISQLVLSRVDEWLESWEAEVCQPTCGVKSNETRG